MTFGGLMSPKRELAGPSSAAHPVNTMFFCVFLILVSEMDVLFRTRYLLSLLFRARAEIEANMPIYGSVFHEAIPSPLTN